MSTTDTEAEASHARAHPTPRDYVNIALILAVLTALEVSTYFFEFGRVAIPLLVILMTIKFVMVAGWFMHLKFDTRLYTMLMYTGLAFALVLYILTVVIVLVGHAPAA
ncbi:MAG: cytochrome C oxidase subunit IV family protein [Nitriliruptoraceae bacterium]